MQLCYLQIQRLSILERIFLHPLRLRVQSPLSYVLLSSAPLSAPPAINAYPLSPPADSDRLNNPPQTLLIENEAPSDVNQCDVPPPCHFDLEDLESFCQRLLESSGIALIGTENEENIVNESNHPFALKTILVTEAPNYEATAVSVNNSYALNISN